MDRAAQTTVMRIEADEATARRLGDALAELLDNEVAVSAFEQTPGKWRVEAHFATPPDEEAMRGAVAGIGGRAAAETARFEAVAQRDWVAESLAGLRPVAAGRFIVHGAHDRGALRANSIGIEIEAALAFGTGHHGTTQGCLLALDAVLKARRPRRILDVGTGTGVLAIAAARATGRPVLASDIDLTAVTVARRNAQLNRVAARLRVIRADGVAGARFAGAAPFDLAFANILLGPLRRLAPLLSRLLAPGARVILSGLLAPQTGAAITAYRAQGLILRRRILLGEWATVVMEKPAPVARRKARR